MSALYCTICNKVPATQHFECNVGGCGNAADACATCLKQSTCAICELAYCSAHIVECSEHATCGSLTCPYCARKLPGKPQILDLNCFDKATSSMVETDIIGSCPLTASLPAPDESIFDDFDPPIELVTYASSKTAARRGVRPANVQAEHFVPNSCFIIGTGRTGAVVKGAGLYSEGKALTYWVGDDQKAGTEHKYLTDCERALCQECESKKQFPTLGQWLDCMQRATAESILQHRDYVGSGEALHAAQKAAYAVRYKMQQHFVTVLKADLNCHLGNGIVGGVAPPKTVTKSQRYDL